jgi:hypothetical protein
MPNTTHTEIAVIDIGKNSFHAVGRDKSGSIVFRQKWSCGQIEARLANLPPCIVGMRPALGRIILPISPNGKAPCGAGSQRCVALRRSIRHPSLLAA